MNESYWTGTSGTTRYPALDARTTADVAVVGGGLAGLWTAWELAQAGRRVAVIEAGRIGAASTGNTTGKATALQSLNFSAIARTAGQDAARRYGQAQLLAVERVAEVSAALSLDCDLERRPAYLYVTLEHTLPELREELTAAVAAGVPAVFRDAIDLPFPVAGALRLDGQIQFHPRKLLLGLAQDLVRRGSVVYEDSRVVAVDDGEPCVAVTEDGASVTAEHLVIATGFPITSTPGPRRALRPRRELVVAGPVPAESVPEGMYITLEDSVRSVRTAPLDTSHRLLIVAGEKFTPGAGGVGERYETLSSWAAAHVGLRQVTHRWSAQDYETEDRVPLIGKASQSPDHAHTWIATGFGGWGLTNAVAAGQLITTGIAGGGLPDWAAPFSPGRLEDTDNDGAARTGGGRSVVRHRIEPGERAAVAAIQPGEGAVVDVGGEHCAAYRDLSGILHLVSAVCSHLGGTVGFNDAEKTWECPCHGSRFAPDGSVLQGPAVRPLAPVTTHLGVAAH
ncbi:FAD-dependent oxidoreductase [Catenulispora subtropica]|uniref:FAD-dependent oxidoreductase n=1 Tax=Catenulispora subtropica TaxID=450798 RepID=A0ABP5EM04_9ACTN